jgi:glycogen operon protein
MKNMLAFTLLATGTPMLLMGDEVGRSQGGNNNGYCQDNEISWFDWSLVEKNAGIYRFVKSLIAFRSNRDLPTERFDMTLTELLRRQPVEWHGVKLNQPDWSDASHTVAATVRLMGYQLLLHIIINAYWEPLDFELPPLTDQQEAWRRCIDTYLDPPDDILRWAQAPQQESSIYRVQPRSMVVLFGRCV